LSLIRMDSWRSLPPHPLKEPGEITSAFARAGVYDYRAAARHVSHLAYGRNNDASDAMVVLSEQRGTCSTKHALLRRLAFEQQLPVKLMLGIFEMSGKNTPGVGSVLKKNGLESLPEAHCYLRAGGRRIDATRDFDGELVTDSFDFFARRRNLRGTNRFVQNERPPAIPESMARAGWRWSWLESGRDLENS